MTVLSLEIDMAIINLLAIKTNMTIKTVIYLSRIEPDIKCKEHILG